MKYKIIEIEGIGETYAKKLEAAGINTTDDLLKAGLTQAGRDIVASNTGIPAQLIYKWTCQADLFRVQGIGTQFAELLNAAGIYSVEDLSKADAAKLAEELRKVDQEKHLTRRVPSEDSLREMISMAKATEPVLSY